jgi:PKD repeat protein
MTPTLLPRPLRLALATVLVAAGLAVPAMAPASADEPAPVSTVGADALPTWQINGVVWSQAVVGNTVVVTGSFTKARPPGVPVGGAGEIDANNLFAYDVRTGNPVAGWSHALDAQGLVVRASADGSRVYVGGDFATVDGTPRGHVAAFDAATGALLPWAPNVGGQVRALALSDDTVYVGGNFPSANGQARTHFAAFRVSTAQMTDWAPTAEGTGGYVWAMVMAPDQTQVIAGGSFSTLNGTAAYGMGALDATTGATRPWAAQDRIRTAGLNGGITSLKTDGTWIYGSGYAFGTGASFEGTFAADPNGGAVRFVNDCLGDTYDVEPYEGALYSVAHAHNCAAINEFPDTNPRSRWQKAMASSLEPGGTITVKDAYGWDFRGFSYAPLVQWYPDLEFGSYTPDRQAAWSVEGGGDYVVLGGEFPKVNNVAQQGLVRFLKKSVGPHSNKPLYSAAMNPVATSTESGTVRIRFNATWDRDDATLRYDLYRNGGATIANQSATSVWWKTPPLQFVDTGLEPGSTHSYKIRVRDEAGNVQWSTAASVTVSSAAPNAYATMVRDDGAQHLWRFEDSGTTTADAVAVTDLTTTGTSTGTGVVGQALTSGGGSTPKAYATWGETQPTAATVEAWVRTTSTRGGRIVGLGSSASGNSSPFDLALYLGNNGRVNAGVRNAAGSMTTTTSAQAVNDGQWHHLALTVDTSGTSIVIDGRRSGRNQNGTGGAPLTGYWRVLADNTSGLGNRPTDAALSGSVDEVAVYGSALSIEKIRSHYTAVTGSDPTPAVPTDTYGAAVTADAPDTYWRLGETGGSVAGDSSSSASPGTYTGVSQYGRPSAVGGTNTAVNLNGTSGVVSSTQAWGAPTTYSAEAWFNTTTTRGGRIVGFGSSSSGLSSSYDRMVCLRNDGKLAFGVSSGGQQNAVTAASYNDGAWHHVVATQGPDGMRLYVDGVERATNPTTTGSSYTGYWRAGGDRCWTGTTSSYLAGQLDDVAIYPVALSAAQVGEHYVASGRTLANRPPTASFTSAATFLSVAFDSSASSDLDGPLAGWSWTFGDGTTSTEQNPVHVYAASGTYPVTLTVTDPGGLSASTTRSVTVGANQVPTATFDAVTTNLKVDVDGSASTDPEGPVASYAWDFGDGATGSGATASHTYAAGGDYTVRLTVTDGAGATATTTRSVTVAPPPNQLPTAAFTTMATFLDATVDASGSSDPDGTLTAYAWDFGDGGTGTGRTAAHSYAAAGTYTVTLTVTDDAGGTASTTRTVTATAVPAVAATDAFGRTVTSGWGTADRGGAWTVSGTASRYSVGGGTAAVVLAAGSSARPLLPSVAQGDTEVSAVATTDKAPTGGGQYISLLARSQAGGSEYRGKVLLASTGAVTAFLARVDGTTETSLGSAVVSGLTYAPGTQLRIRLQATGSAPTTLRLKVWVDGQPEPAAWALTRTDATAALQGTGAVGFYHYVSGSATNAPVTFRVDDVWAGEPRP